MQQYCDSLGTHSGTQCKAESKAGQFAFLPEHKYVHNIGGSQMNIAWLWTTDPLTYQTTLLHDSTSHFLELRYIFMNVVAFTKLQTLYLHSKLSIYIILQVHGVIDMSF